MSDTETRASEVRKTNVTLNRQDIRDFKRLMLDWEEENEFPIELKESHCLNAAVKLIIRASSPELVDEYAKKNKADENATKQLHDLYDWFLKQYIEMLRGVIDDRVGTDKRRQPRFSE